MHQARLILLMFKPSLFSFIGTNVVAIIILIVANRPVVTRNPVLYEYFYGPQGLTTVLRQSTDSFSAFTKALSAQFITYEVLVFVAAVTVGFLVYFALQFISNLLSGATSMILEVHEADKKAKKFVAAEVFTRLLVRVGALIAWFFYTVFFMKVLLPFCILSVGMAIVGLFDNFAWAYAILGYIGLVAGLHLHIVFMRLVVLKPRLFGGHNEIMEAMLD
jgi:hypothetical protein